MVFKKFIDVVAKNIIKIQYSEKRCNKKNVFRYKIYQKISEKHKFISEESYNAK